MREALDNMDGCGGVDDVTGQTSSLYLSDDYKEVKGCVVCLIESIFNRSFIDSLMENQRGQSRWNIIGDTCDFVVCSSIYEHTYIYRYFCFVLLKE